MRSLPMQRACLELRVASVAEIGPGQQNLNPGHTETHARHEGTHEGAHQHRPTSTSITFLPKGPGHRSCYCIARHSPTGSYLLCVLDLETVI
jgi:hypothetical protein